MRLAQLLAEVEAMMVEAQQQAQVEAQVEALKEREVRARDYWGRWWLAALGLRAAGAGVWRCRSLQGAATLCWRELGLAAHRCRTCPGSPDLELDAGEPRLHPACRSTPRSPRSWPSSRRPGRRRRSRRTRRAPTWRTSCASLRWAAGGRAGVWVCCAVPALHRGSAAACGLGHCLALTNHPASTLVPSPHSLASRHPAAATARTTSGG
jgi:hypothetical protein